jgi:23S rRNA pseudouridine2605 synthase
LPKTQTILLNKPAGYICSRNGQGGETIYDLLPAELRRLKPVGRLDKDSSGLLLMTNDGDLAQRLTHPSYQKDKVYELSLDKALTPHDWEQITHGGVQLDDGMSAFKLHWQHKNNSVRWIVTMHQGRNRQIRRTFAALGYQVTRLHRTKFGNYELKKLVPGSHVIL